MKVYSLGPDELGESEIATVSPDDHQWLVYYYKIGDYCGDGEAVALRNDGTLWSIGMSHCSCHGPIDSYKDGSLITFDELIARKEWIYDRDWLPQVKAKVCELLGREAP